MMTAQVAAFVWGQLLNLLGGPQFARQAVATASKLSGLEGCGPSGGRRQHPSETRTARLCDALVGAVAVPVKSTAIGWSKQRARCRPEPHNSNVIVHNVWHIADDPSGA